MCYDSTYLKGSEQSKSRETQSLVPHEESEEWEMNSGGHRISFFFLIIFIVFIKIYFMYMNTL